MKEQEKLLSAKIVCPESGIEIRHSVCDICTPGPQCGLNVYVKDGKAVKIEGDPDHPVNRGKLCTKGAACRQYVYRDDRIKTPMKRVGERGSSDFVPISWEEAYDTIESNLRSIKETYGAESVAWFTGYTKWIRPWLRRLCMSFGGHNYMTESSTCFLAGKMANMTIFGKDMRADLMGGPGLVAAWACNPYINMFKIGQAYVRAKENGAKIIVVDVRHTQAAEKLADLFLRPRIGTDIVLAHAIANVIIQNGWQDQAFIDRYVHGYEEYKQMISQYDLETAQRITGVSKEDILTAAQWMAQIKPAAIAPSNGIVHHSNGYNAHRAVMCLNVITGNVDKKGTLLPCVGTYCDIDAGFPTHEHEFMHETETPKTVPQIGEERFPLWNQMTGDAQTMDLPRQILEGTPYPIHALAAFGVNTRIFPEPRKFREALQKTDFIFATDLFWTEMCTYADIVLPVCSSLERSEVKCYAGGNFYYTSPVIEPLYESRDDVTVMTELAKRLCPEDTVLCSGYHGAIRYMFREIADEMDTAKASGRLEHSKTFRPYIPGSYLEKGPDTITGKLELYSELIAQIDPKYHLDPLPVFYDSDHGSDREKYPFTLMTGARLPHTIHSRAHKVPWLRSLRPCPSVDISPADAARLGIAQDDPVKLSTEYGEIHVKANVTEVANKGELHMIHGYEEANASDLMSWEELDPYSGFPSYKQFCCALEKEDMK